MSDLCILDIATNYQEMRNKLLIVLLLVTTFGWGQVPTPESVLGFKPGADYKIADYEQTSAYFNRVAETSPRVQITTIGETSMGRPMWLMFISSEDNLKKLESFRETSEKLARARISESEARKLAASGKAIVWIDAGMHATERAGAQMVPDLLYTLATDNSPEFNHIRENVIILLCPNLNPDGQTIVANWYKQQLGTPWETTSPPVLYQKYVGHDNNRDWFMNNMQETRNVTKVLYNEWYPQIVHNHHQTSPSWARIFLPPFRSPVNQRIHPGVTTAVNLTGTAMANYFAMKKMPGVISGVSYSMWWNGGMRTAPYFHNMVGILTETGHSTPTPRFYPPDSIPKRVGGTTANGSEIFYPYPWEGGESHFGDAVNYMKNASFGILNLAADRREDFLYNIYTMGRDAIEGKVGEQVFAYVVPREQWDRAETINLIHVLQRGGVEVHEATKDAEVNDVQIAKGDFVIYSAQAFKPYLVDLLEKQTYPDQYRYPGGPPRPPYDLAGWTLPMQMGVTVHRMAQTFDIKAKELDELANPTKGSFSRANTYILSAKQNASALAVNRLMKAGANVSRAEEDGGNAAMGDFIVSGNVQPILQQMADEYGLDAVAADYSGATRAMRPIKIGLYKSWQANMDEGWTRWVLEQFEFELDTLHNAEMTGDLSQYTAIILPSQSSSGIMHGYRSGYMPEKFTGGLGLEGTLSLENYVQSGGVLIAFDNSTDFVIDQFGLPVRNVTRGLSPSSFFIPGSIVRMNTDTTHPIGWGMMEESGAFFSRSRAFKRVLKSSKGEGGNEEVKAAPEPDLDIVARYAQNDILMSGWAMGQNRYLKNNGSLMNVRHGDGQIVLFGFRPQFRGQPRGTYKLIFNAIYLGAYEN